MKLNYMRLHWLKANKIAVSSMALNIILGASVLSLSYGLATKHERVIIVPPVVNNAFEVQWNGASSSYYQDFSIFITTTMGSTTKSNVNYNLDVIAKFATPQVYKIISERLRGYVSNLSVDLTYASWFTPMDVKYEPASNKVFVIGSLSSSAIANRTDTKDVVYEFQWQIVGGKPEFYGFDSYVGTEPRTLLWLKNNPTPQTIAPEQAPPTGVPPQNISPAPVEKNQQGAPSSTATEETQNAA